MQMTLPRLLVTTSWIGCGALLAKDMGTAWGPVGYCFGFALGFIGAFVLTWAFLLGRFLLFFPFPSCQRGKCNRVADYVWKKGSIYGYEKGGIYRYKCRCNDEYIRRGKRFLEVLPDGTARPYKRLIGFRKWADDLKK